MRWLRVCCPLLHRVFVYFTMSSNQRCLLDLSTELLVMIAKQIEKESDIYAFAQASQRLYSASINHLYIQNSSNSDASALLWAAECGNVDTLRLAHDANVTISRVDVMAAAAEHGQLGVIQFLYEVYGAAITELPWACAGDPSPVTLAVQHHHQELLEYLCQIGFDVEYNDNKPLVMAAYYGNQQAARYLLAHGANVHAKEGQDSPLLFAILYANFQVAEVLLEHGAEVNCVVTHDRDSLLHFAITRGASKEMVELLVRHGADLTATNVYGAVPLAFAILKHRHDGAMAILENSHVNYNEPLHHDKTPLNLAVHNGNSKLTKELIARGADAFARDPGTGWTTLHFAASQQISFSVNVIQTLIEHGLPLDAFDLKGETPLCLAVRGVDDDCFKEFLIHATDINAAVTTNGRTVLHEAAKYAIIRKLEFLLAQPSIDINCQDAFGRTPLFYAARSGSPFVLEVLLLNGASTTIADNYGATPLFTAVRNGREEETRLLLSSTPDSLTQRDGFGHSLLWWAQKNRTPAVQDLILQYAAETETAMDLDSEPGPDILDVSYDRTACLCDVCTRSVENHDWLGPAWQCPECYGGTFIICFDCALLREEGCPGGELHREKWDEHNGCALRNPEKTVRERPFFMY